MGKFWLTMLRRRAITMADDKYYEVNSYIHYHEYDHKYSNPILVIQGAFPTRGYKVDPESGELELICLCHARHDRECCCAYSYEVC